MESKKLTAVQELIEWVKKERDNTHKIELFRPRIEQLDALEELFKSKLKKEKQQIVDAVDGFPLNARHLDGEQYYNEIYGNNI